MNLVRRFLGSKSTLNLSFYSIQALFIRVSAQAINFLIPFIILKVYHLELYGFIVLLSGIQALGGIADWGKQIPFQNRISQIGLESKTLKDWLFRESNFKWHLVVNLSIVFLAISFGRFWFPVMFDDSSLSLIMRFEPVFYYALAATFIYGTLYIADSLMIGLGLIKQQYVIVFLSNLLVLICLLLLIVSGARETYIIGVAISGPLLQRVFSLIFVLVNKHRMNHRTDLREEPVSVPREYRSLHKLSLMFLYLQLLSLVANNIDAVYLAQVNMTLADIGKYGFYLKIFGAALMITSMLNSIKMPLISASAHSVENRFGFDILLSLMKTNIIIGLVYSSVILIFLKQILLFFHNENLLDYQFALLIVIYICVSVFRDVLTVFINAVESMKWSLIGNSFFSIAQTPLKLFLIGVIGVYGLPVANIFGYIVLLLPFHLVSIIKHKAQFKLSSES